MGTRSVEADRGITPTIAHAPTGIVHGQPSAEADFEKVPIFPMEPSRKWFRALIIEKNLFDCKATVVDEWPG
jgi:hypothetical protein